MPRTKPKPIFCGVKEEHEEHENCQGYVSPKREKESIDSNNVDDLNRLWIPIAPLRLELAKLAKEGMDKYPLGEIILMMRKILREDTL